MQTKALAVLLTAVRLGVECGGDGVHRLIGMHRKYILVYVCAAYLLYVVGMEAKKADIVLLINKVTPSPVQNVTAPSPRRHVLSCRYARMLCMKPRLLIDHLFVYILE